MNDGAAALVLMSKEKAVKHGLKPLAVIRGYADAEQAPEWFTPTPSQALPRAVAKAGLKMEDLNYVELNEAFSVVGIANIREMKLDPARVSMLTVRLFRSAIRSDVQEQELWLRLFIF